jgi:hypothetical protein
MRAVEVFSYIGTAMFLVGFAFVVRYLWSYLEFVRPGRFSR